MVKFIMLVFYKTTPDKNIETKKDTITSVL